MRASLVSITFAFLAAGCSLLLNTAEPTQCVTTDDCAGSSALHGRVCQAGFCVLPTTPLVPVDTDGGSGCVSTAICTQANSNRASVCKTAGGPCVPWQTEACPLVRGAWDDPNAIVIGTIGPQTILQVDKTALKSDYTARVLKAIDLGRDELEADLPQGRFTFGSTNRPVAIVHCDSQLDAKAAQAAMDHLTDVVGVAAVITVADEDLAAIADKAIAKKTAVICTDCLGPLPPQTLAWRAAPPIELEAPMLAWRVKDIETKLHATQATIKVATLSDPSMAAIAFMAALQGQLVFNGALASSQIASGAYHPVQIPDGRKVAIDFNGIAQQIVDAEPDVIIVSMAENFTTFFLPLIEQKWHVGKAKPQYVANQLSNEADAFNAAIKTDDALRKRISGTRPLFDAAIQANLDGFTSRYKQTNNFQKPDGAQGGYDAIYSLGLAIGVASTQGPYDGAHVSAGFASLVSGATLDYDPTSLKSGLITLFGGAKVDVRGTASRLDWDPATKDLVNDVGMFCLVRDGNGAIAFNPDAGPRYSAAAKTITGAFVDCN